MKKILVISKNNPFLQNNATSNRIISLLLGLQTKGVDIKVLITGGLFAKNEEHSQIVKGIALKHILPIPNYTIWYKRINTFVLNKLIKKIVICRLKKYFVSDFDYIWILPNECAYLAVEKYKSIAIPKFFIELNEYPDIYKEQKLNKFQFRNAVKEEQAFYKAIKFFDRFAIMTKRLLLYYNKLSNPSADFIHLPMTVDVSRFKDKQTTNIYPRPYIAYIGSFNNAKDGVDILIKAFAKISEKYPDISLLMAGYYYKDVEGQMKLIKEYGIENRVKYYKPLSVDEVPSFLCNASVLALARPDSHQAQGGFPTKLGEYLSTGKPVCVTRVGEISDYLIDDVSAFLADPGNVDSFAAALDRALSDSEKAAEVGLNGKDVAISHFDSQKQAERLYNFLFK